MSERRFYIDTASDPWRQIVVEPDGTIHEADPDDPDLIAAIRARDEREALELEPDSLDAAWAEAEAALPPIGEDEWGFAVSPVTMEGQRVYRAVAWNVDRVDGPTPAAALRALAAKLRERGA